MAHATPTLALTIVLILVISGCGQSYNPEQDRVCRGCDMNVAALLRSQMLIGKTEVIPVNDNIAMRKGWEQGKE